MKPHYRIVGGKLRAIRHRSPRVSHLITLAGGPAAVGRICGVTSQAVSQWKTVPVHHCQAIERATAGAVSRTDLRPDVWPPEEKENRRAA